MTIQLTLIAVLGTGALWKISDLILGRRAYSPLLRWIVSIFVLIGVGNALSLPKPLRWLDATVFLGAGRLIFNAIIIAGLCATVSLGFVATARRRRVRYEIVACGATITAMCAITALIPSDHRGHSLTSRDLTDPAVTLFYAVGNAYFIYAYLTAARTIWRLSRHAPAVPSYGLRILAAGLGGLGITCVVRMSVILGEERVGLAVNTWNFAAANCATIVVCFGLCLPALAQTIGAIRLRRLRRQQLVILHPLWERLGHAFPELLFDNPACDRHFSPRRRLRRESVNWRLYRYYVECRDGLTRLSPYLADVAASQHLQVEALCAADVASLIDPALALRPTHEEKEIQRPAQRIAVAPGANFDEDIMNLIDMARSLPDRCVHSGVLSTI